MGGVGGIPRAIVQPGRPALNWIIFLIKAGMAGLFATRQVPGILWKPGEFFLFHLFPPLDMLLVSSALPSPLHSWHLTPLFIETFLFPDSGMNLLLSGCIRDIRSGMSCNFLQFNIYNMETISLGPVTPQHPNVFKTQMLLRAYLNNPLLLSFAQVLRGPI